MERKCWCVICHEYKVRYTPRYEMCQKCYREMLVEYSYYKYKEGIVKPKEGSSARKICEIARGENIRAREIVEKYGKELGVSNIAYVRSIITMYMERCDTMDRSKEKYRERIDVKKIG